MHESLDRRKLLIGTIPIVAVAAIFVFAIVLAKNVSASPDKGLMVDSEIQVTPESDLNHNTQLDAGETARFTFTITNTSSTDLKFAKLNTKIPMETILLIKKLSGTPSLDDSGEFLTLPNLRIGAHQKISVYVDALMQISNMDKQVTSIPGLVDQHGKPVATGAERQVMLRHGVPGQGGAGQINVTSKKVN